MNGWVEAPPRQPMGCFAKGCLIVAVFAVVLAIACSAGMYWGFHRYSAVMRSFYWLTKAHAISNVPAPIPSHEASAEKIENVVERWRDFETAARSGREAEIELTADDLNDLISSDPDTRSQIFASIDQNRVRLQTNLPVGEVVGRSNYYLVADVTIQSDGEQSLVSPHLSSITINNRQLPADLLEWTYRSRRLRNYLAENESPWNAMTFEIRDGKVILRARGE